MHKSYLLLLSVLLFSCSKNIVKSPDHLSTFPIKITIEGEAKHKISPNLFGYNIVYAETPDGVWENGAIKKFTKETNTSFIRYPGGTVVTFWHWKEPTGNGWNDSWDPTHNIPDKPNSEFMDIDEYLSLIQELNINPMIGVNINSGQKYNRMEEGIKDALDLMDYCADKGINVEYWYLGNEPYMHDCNGGPLTVEEYALLINIYADAMREKNPSIKLIANWLANFYQKEEDYIELLKLAGHNIDIIDVHHYWDWNSASWERWLQKTPIGLWTGQTFIDNIKKFREIAEENDYPDIQLATLEWNAGPGKSNEVKLSAAQNAFIQSEMMLQFMLGGMDIATFWPLFWKSGQFNERGIYDFNRKILNPNAMLLTELSKFSGNNYFNTHTVGNNNNMIHILSEDPLTKVLRGCVLNKNSEITNFTVTKPALSAYNKYSIVEYHLTDNNTMVKEDITTSSTLKKNELNFLIKPYSIAFIEIQ